MEYKYKILKPATVTTLRKAEFDEIYIQFFDSLSGAAQALNKSKNPVKAANTMFANPTEIKPGNKRSYEEMLRTFVQRREAQNTSTARIPAELHKLIRGYTHEELAAPFDPEMNEENDSE